MTHFSGQDDYFAVRGGDEYFRRNHDTQAAPRRDLSAYTLLNALPSGSLPDVGRAAVLGGAAGREAAWLSEILPNWELTNVDISPQAIEFGKQTFPDIRHHCLNIATSEPSLSSVIGQQDLIFVVAVFHWIDRLLLPRAIANVDESLRDGGHLLIADFLPSTKRKNPISHNPDYFTYKQDYAACFVSFGTYELVSQTAYVAEQPKDFPRQNVESAINSCGRT